MFFCGGWIVSVATHPALTLQASSATHAHILPTLNRSLAGASQMLLMHNRVYAAEIAHQVSARTRGDIEQRAQELNIKVLNPDAGAEAEEDE